MTRANRSAALAADGTTGAIDKLKATINARRILIPRQSSQNDADPSLRLGDLTPRKSHYQTAPASTLNARESRKWPRRFTATRSRAAPFGACRHRRAGLAFRATAAANVAGVRNGDIDGIITATYGVLQRFHVPCMIRRGFDLLAGRWLATVSPITDEKSSADGKRLRNLRAPLCDDAAHPSNELPFA
jgi:hypothetical protein